MSTAPKLTVHADDTEPTPTEAVVRAAKKFVTVTDTMGRELKVKRLSGLDKLDLAKICGADGCGNPAVIGPATMAYSVREIDGEPVLPPNSWGEMRALVSLLDDEGLQAVEDVYIENWSIKPKDGTDQDNLKNG